mgnify:CR=1 FL=1
MVDWGEGELIVRSRLKQIITQLEMERGERISQKEIAEATGLSENAISRWMSPRAFARIESDAATRLCKYLRVSLGDLVYIDEVHPSQ